MSERDELARQVGAPTDYPPAWLAQRGLHPMTGIDWWDADQTADPIPEKVWAYIVSQLEVIDPSGCELPAILTVGKPDDECLVLADVADSDDRHAALVTALATASRLYEALLDQLATAAALRSGLEVKG